MQNRRTLRLLAIAALAVTAAACDEDPTGLSGPRGRSIFAVDESNSLVVFGAMRPDQADEIGAITGLQSGEMVIGIDFRPVDGRLYAIGSTSRIYVVDTATAAATVVAATAFTPTLSGAAFGVDFNPVPDRIRTHSDTEQNLRLHPGTGAVGGVDGTLAYMTGDAGAGSNPVIAGTAYTSSVAGATTTALFAIDASRDVLVTLAAPNDGMMRTVGALGVTTSELVGFDIAGSDGSAYATLSGSGARSTLYAINLTTGAATRVGEVDNVGRLRGIAIAP